MRSIIFSLTVSALVVLGTVSADASGSRYCMRSGMASGRGNCTFASMAQCRATASGRTGMTCMANPFYKRPAR